ncbi:MAG: LamG-like jellyroll fold domain-containing protein, partial [Planctomycetota bacterium]
ISGTPTAAGTSASMTVTAYNGVTPDATQVFQLKVVYPGLVAWYKFDEGAGAPVAFDETGNNDGMNVSVTTGVPGRIGNAYSFDATDDVVSCGTFDPSGGGGAFTLTFWTSWDGATASSQALAAKRDSWAVGDMMWQLDLDTGNTFFLREAGSSAVFTQSLPVGTWTHVAVVYDGAFATLYLNAGAPETLAFAAGTDTAAAVVVGAGQIDAVECYNGDIDDVRFFNYALNATDITSIYNEAFAATPPVIRSAPPPAALEGQAYSHTFTAGGSPAPSFALDDPADLPAGLGWDAPTATISGTPTAPGTSASITVTATNPMGTDKQSFTITVGEGVDPDLDAHWELDETGGDTADDATATDGAPGEYDGTLVNFPSDGSQWVGGYVGGALHFDGVDDYVTTNLNIDQSDLGPRAATFAAWVKPDSTSAGDHFVISTDDGGNDWSLVRNGATWHVWYGNGVFDTGVSADPGVWQHIIVVFGSGPSFRFQFCKNFTGEPLGDVIGYDTSDTNITIGGRAGGGDHFDGTIDDVRIYSKAFASVDFAALENEYYTPPTSQITSPVDGQTFAAGADITITGDATDDFLGVQVDLYHDAQLLLADASPPWSHTWLSVPAGTYVLTARATDNLGATTTSAPVSITVGSIVTISKGSDAAEPSTNGSFIVSRTGYTGGDITVNFAVNAGNSTAAEGNDFTLSPAGSIVIPAPQTQATINVQLMDDGDLEPQETVVVDLQAGAGYTLGPPATAVVVISDDDGGGRASPAWLVEGNSGLMDGSNNFLGTTDNVPVNIIAGGETRMRVDLDGVDVGGLA